LPRQERHLRLIWDTFGTVTANPGRKAGGVSAVNTHTTLTF
jgi:hypothetical protein